MLHATGLNQFYGGSHILRDVDLELAQGRRFCLMGRNGVGKTTLLSVLMGLLPIKSGRILFEGQDLASRPAALRAHLGVGYVPQGRGIFSDLTVEENLIVGLTGRRDGGRNIPPFIYEYFPVLRDMAQRKGGNLSGGQQQQLAIGRALAGDPKLLVLDEPTEGIQPNIVQMIGDILLKLNKELGVTLLLVTQNLNFARKVGEEFAIMDRGHMVASGDMQELGEGHIAEFLTA